MGLTYTLTVRCDIQQSPDCLREWAHSTAQVRDFDHVSLGLYKQGWHLGYERDRIAVCCDACWPLEGREHAQDEEGAASAD